MGCGCFGKMIQNASKDEFLEKVFKIAKYTAVDEGTWYVVVRKNDGSYAYMPDQYYDEDNCGEIVVRVSPMP